MAHFYNFQKSFFYVIVYIIATVAAVCYLPNGLSVSSPSYQPCDDINGVTSMCCALNRTNPSGGNIANGVPADKCLPNGLCEFIFATTYDNGSTITQTTYTRDYCTDASWKSGSCLNICTKETDPVDGVSDGWIYMTPCDGTANSSTWCCNGNTTCCGTEDAITLAQTLAATATTSSSTQTTLPSTTAATTTTTSQLSAPSSSSSSSGLSTGAKAGIGVGVSVGCLGIIIAVGIFIFRRRKDSKGTPTDANTAVQEYSPLPKTQDNLNHQVSGLAELSSRSQSARHELPADPA